jgi:hypothetical protein
MKWIVWTATNGQLWYARPFYNDLARVRKPEFADLKLPKLPKKTASITDGLVTVTLGGVTYDGESIYADTDEERRDRWMAKNILDPNVDIDATIPYYLIEATDLPADHECGIGCMFQRAWEWDGTKVVTNMPKARVIRMARITQLCNQRLAELVEPYLHAIELGDTVAQQRVGALRQALRDIPQTFDLEQFTTPEALKAALPPELERG